MKEQRGGRKSPAAEVRIETWEKSPSTEKWIIFNYFGQYRPHISGDYSAEVNICQKWYLFSVVLRGKSFNREFARVAHESAFQPFLHTGPLLSHVIFITFSRLATPIYLAFLIYLSTLKQINRILRRRVGLRRDIKSAALLTSLHKD